MQLYFALLKNKLKSTDFVQNVGIVIHVPDQEYCQFISIEDLHQNQTINQNLTAWFQLLHDSFDYQQKQTILTNLRFLDIDNDQFLDSKIKTTNQTLYFSRKMTITTTPSGLPTVLDNLIQQHFNQSEV